MDKTSLNTTVTGLVQVIKSLIQVFKYKYLNPSVHVIVCIRLNAHGVRNKISKIKFMLR